MDTLNKAEYKRFVSNCPVRCRILTQKIHNLADYISVISASITSRDVFWFRGHEDAKWTLIPSALRYSRAEDRTRALKLLSEFKRVAEIKIPRPPRPEEELKWVQLAQHYGLPTRLLDWTESATIALYFACLKTRLDGVVFMLNPVDLNKLSYPSRPRIFDFQSDDKIIKKLLSLSGRQSKRGPGTIAVNPTWNSERLMLQKSVFTLHGARFGLNEDQAPSLVAVPILKESKLSLREELGRIGVDESSIFPELEYTCNFLKRRANLDQESL